jgi:hypothetical protein
MCTAFWRRLLFPRQPVPERDADVARESGATRPPDGRAAGERLPTFLAASHAEEVDQGRGVGAGVQGLGTFLARFRETDGRSPASACFN